MYLGHVGFQISGNVLRENKSFQTLNWSLESTAYVTNC